MEQWCLSYQLAGCTLARSLEGFLELSRKRSEATPFWVPAQKLVHMSKETGTKMFTEARDTLGVLCPSVKLRGPQLCMSAWLALKNILPSENRYNSVVPT